LVHDSCHFGDHGGDLDRFLPGRVAPLAASWS
jgi:hypothetical protein